jgi:hypothetical protein
MLWHYITADEPVLKDRVCIQQQWEAARFTLKKDIRQKKGIRVLWKVQKISGWSDTVKRLWDEGSAVSHLRLRRAGVIRC